MAATIYQGWTYTPAANTLTGGPSGAVAVGDDIDIIIRAGSANVPDINDATLGTGKDSLGNTYTVVDSNVITGSIWGWRFHSKVTVAGTPGVRVIISGAGQMHGEGVVISGADLVTPIAQHTKNASANANGASGNVTTTSPKVLLVVGYILNTTATTFVAGANYALPASVANADTEVQYESRYVTATGTYGGPMSWTGSISYLGLIAAYVDAVQTSGGVPLGFLVPDDAL